MTMLCSRASASVQASKGAEWQPYGAQVSLAAEHIRNEKVKVLRSMKRLSMDDVVVGQYRGRAGKENKKPGYLDDDTVPEGRSAPADMRNLKRFENPKHKALARLVSCLLSVFSMGKAPMQATYCCCLAFPG